MLAGLVAVLIFLAGALLVLGQIGRREGIRDARQFAVLAGQGIVEPNVADGLLAGEPAAVERLDRVVQERVLGRPRRPRQDLDAGRAGSSTRTSRA